MLVFLIHGVATRDVEDAEPLIRLIKQEFIERDLPLPHFRSSFWGDVLSDIGKLWNYIYEDLRKASARSDKTPSDRMFRYQGFRQGFFSKFIGDFFTYLNPDRGKGNSQEDC